MSYDIPEIVVESEYTAFTVSLRLCFALFDEREAASEEIVVDGNSIYTQPTTYKCNRRVIHESEILCVPDLQYEFEPVHTMKMRLAKSLLERLPANVHSTVAHEIVDRVCREWVRHRINLTLTGCDLQLTDVFSEGLGDLPWAEDFTVDRALARRLQLTRSSTFALALGR